MSICRCNLHIGENLAAIKTGVDAAQARRSFPGVNKLLAEAQEADGDIEWAERTISRATFYETPWDNERARDAKEYLKDLGEWI
mmetsp:Transcript_8725/g.21741  ORF Transcript_8725/g.21741 Transcript_8725/m.21741 type:complete len:84 (-) Transcript_8725:78-329(-)